MGQDNTSTQTAPSQDVLSTLLNAGASPQAQQQSGNLIQGLLSLLQHWLI